MEYIKITAEELRRKLTDVFVGIWSGGSYEVTRNGRPVARIVPVPPEEPADDGERLAGSG